MTNLIVLILELVHHLIGLYFIVVIATIVMSWLMSFGVVNPYNPTVRAIYDGLQRMTEPLLRPIRRVMPDLGAIDLSPIVLLLGCTFAQGLIARVLIPAVMGA